MSFRGFYLAAILAGLLGWVNLIGPLGAGAETPRGETPEKIDIVYCRDCIPFQFTHESGKPAGIIIDYWKAWEEKTGIEVHFQAATWDETLSLMRDKKADVHAGLFYNKARDRFLEYGAPLTETSTNFFTHESLSQIESTEELAAFRVGVLSGDFVEGFLKERLPAGTVIHFETYDAIMEALRVGDLKVFAADTPTALFHLRQAGLADQFAYPAGKPLYRNKWFVAATEGDSELIEVINSGMASLSTEEKRAIESRWVGLEVKFGLDYTTLLVWLLPIAAVAALLIGFVTVWNRRLAHEIAERVRTHLELASERERLNQAYRELSEQHEQLKMTQSQLLQSEKMASLGVLVAGIAHEINNPTNFVHGGARNLGNLTKGLREFIYKLAGDELSGEIKRKLDEKFRPLQENLEAIQDGTQRIRDIVHGLRTFSRTDEEDPESVSVIEGLAATLDLVRAKYKDQVEFTCEFKADPVLRCWPAQLNQVFMNLAINGCQAIIAAPQSGKTALGRLIVSTFMQGEDFGIRFRDNGAGMSVDVKKRVFEPFFTTKPVGEGTGLGLSISYGIVEKHGGRIEVESSPGLGSSLTILLPLNIA